MHIYGDNVEREMAVIDFLIVDDSEAFVKLTKRILQKSGLEYTSADASNGKTALKVLAERETCPDVILLDMNMPVMNGFEFLDQYIEEGLCTDRTLIYILTSSTMEQDKMRARLYPQLRAYFEKPLTKEDIERIVSDLAERDLIR